MKVIAAPNAFKESLSASAAATAIATGVRRAIPRCDVVDMPIADGGDGTREVLVSALGGEDVGCDAHDPLGRPIRAAFGRIDGGRTAVVDVAAASGLALLAPEERDPMRASSFGTGEILRKAIEGGAARLLLGVGGSATVDAGPGPPRRPRRRVARWAGPARRAERGRPLFRSIREHRAGIAPDEGPGAAGVGRRRDPVDRRTGRGTGVRSTKGRPPPAGRRALTGTAELRLRGGGGHGAQDSQRYLAGERRAESPLRSSRWRAPGWSPESIASSTSSVSTRRPATQTW